MIRLKKSCRSLDVHCVHSIYIYKVESRMDARFENGGAFIYTTSQEEEAGVGAITRACQSWRVMASSKPRSWKCICVCVKTSKSCLLPSFLFSYFIHKWSVYIYYRVRASYGWLTAALLLTRARAEQQQVTLWAGPGTSPYINIYISWTYSL